MIYSYLNLHNIANALQYLLISRTFLLHLGIWITLPKTKTNITWLNHLSSTISQKINQKKIYCLVQESNLGLLLCRSVEVEYSHRV